MTMRTRLLTAALLAAALFAALAAPARADDNNIKELKAEVLGQPIRGMQHCQSFLVPKPEKAGFYLVTSYNSLIRNNYPCHLVVLDMDTGKLLLSENRKPSGPLARMAIGPDGRAYMGCHGYSGLYVFDPKTASLEWHGYPKLDTRLAPTVVVAARDDGRVYYGTASAISTVLEYDPKTDAFRDFGSQGPKEKWPRGIYSLAVDDTHIYTAVGKNPWYLVAADRKTMAQEVLLSGPAYLTVTGAANGAFASVQEKAADKERVYYRLSNGKAEKLAGPPETKRLPRVGHVYNRAPTQRAFPGEPTVNFSRARVTSAGTAEIWWRMPKSKEWRSVEITGIATKPWDIEVITAMPDGRIFGSAHGTEDSFIYDPKTNAFEALGKTPLSTYELLPLGDRIYLGGYHGTYIAEYDPARPWTYFTSTPVKKEPELTAPESNPRECHRWSATNLKTHYVRGMAVGSDGWIYFCAHAERLDVGGALGWWDPVKREPGGLREPFAVQDGDDIAAARGGDLMVYSSRPVSDPSGKLPTPKEAKLFLFDIKTKKIVGEVAPLPGLSTCGHIAADGDLVYGFGRIGDAYHYYVYDLAKGETVHHEALAGEVRERPARGRDGNYYLFIGDTLTRLDAKTFALTPLGVVKTNGPLVALGADLYWPSDTRLCRLRNMIP